MTHANQEKMTRTWRVWRCGDWAWQSDYWILMYQIGCFVLAISGWLLRNDSRITSDILVDPLS